MNEMLSQEEFDEISEKLINVFRNRNLSIRDGIRIMMMVSIESCLTAAPTLSVALAELTKLFVQGLSPAVRKAMEAEMKLFDMEEEDDEAI